MCKNTPFLNEKGANEMILIQWGKVTETYGLLSVISNIRKTFHDNPVYVFHVSVARMD